MSKSDLVYTATTSNVVIDMVPLPVFIHDKPVLFASIANSGDDFVEEKLMFFNGKHYEWVEGNKIIFTH